MNLNFRKLRKSDLLFYHQIMGDKESMFFISDKANSLAESERELYRLVDRYKFEKKEGIWIFFHNHTDQFIGLVSLIKNEKGEIELMYKVNRQFWGQGFGKKLAVEAVNLAFELGIPNLFVQTAISNIASVKIIDSLSPLQIKELHTLSGIELYTAYLDTILLHSKFSEFSTQEKSKLYYL